MNQDYEMEEPKVGHFYFMSFQGEFPNLAEPFYVYTGLREFESNERWFMGLRKGNRKSHEVLYFHRDISIPENGPLTTFRFPEDRFVLVPNTGVIDGRESRFVSVAPGTSDHKRLNDFLVELERK